MASQKQKEPLLGQCKSDSSLLTGAARLTMHTRWALPWSLQRQGPRTYPGKPQLLWLLSPCWLTVRRLPSYAENRWANLWAHLQGSLMSTQGGLGEQTPVSRRVWRNLESCASKRCTAVWLTLGTGCSSEWGTRFSVIFPSLSALLQLRKELLPFWIRWLQTKVSLCLLTEQTYEVSQVFIWCLSFLPWKMGNSLLVCTPQKLIGATNFLTLKSTSDLTTNAVLKRRIFSWLFSN